MTEKICPNGHVYNGNKCDRDNWQEPSEEVKAPEVQSSEEKTGSKPVKGKKAATKTSKSSKGKKSKKSKYFYQ